MKSKVGWIPLQVAALVAAGCSVGTQDETVEERDELRADVMRVEEGVADEGAEVPMAQTVSFRVPETEVAELTSEPESVHVDHAREGRSAWEAGDPARAARELRIAIDAGDASDYDVYLLGLSLWKSGELDESATVLADATWRLEGFVKAPVNLARVRLALGAHEAAEEAVRKAIEIDPDYGPAHNVLGRTLFARGLTGDAAAAFHRAAELSDDDPWPHNNLGYLMLVSGRTDRAIAPLERAIEIDEGLAVAWHNLALAQEREGRMAAAAIAAARAGDLGGNDRYVATAERLAHFRDASVDLAELTTTAETAVATESVSSVSETDGSSEGPEPALADAAAVGDTTGR